jgi:hypothetical protein
MSDWRTLCQAGIPDGQSSGRWSAAVGLSRRARPFRDEGVRSRGLWCRCSRQIQPRYARAVEKDPPWSGLRTLRSCFGDPAIHGARSGTHRLVRPSPGIGHRERSGRLAWSLATSNPRRLVRLRGPSIRGAGRFGKQGRGPGGEPASQTLEPVACRPWIRASATRSRDPGVTGTMVGVVSGRMTFVLMSSGREEKWSRSWRPREDGRSSADAVGSSTGP